MLVYILLGAVAVVVFGSLITEGLSVYGVIREGTLFSQQWEYLDLPRLWQILLVAGLFIWIAIIWRGLRSTLKTQAKTSMPWLFFFSGLAIPAFYAVGLLAGSDTHFSVADFWRFWVVHLWVEDFLELKKNHGKEEMRARDLFYAMWVPDLFMKRVEQGGDFLKSLFI
mgnify:CR=1 FL=1